MQALRRSSWGEEREDGDDSGGKADKSDDTAGDGNGRAKKRRRKAQFVKKDESARSKTQQIVPDGADLTFFGADLTCYRAWKVVGEFFPVLPNVVNEECFPYEYRWDKNQPPIRSGDFKEFNECMGNYKIELHFVDFFDNTLDRQLKSWVTALNKKSLMPIEYTSQVCQSAFIESEAAKSDSSARKHVQGRRGVRQNSNECGPIAAGVTYTGYRQWQDGFHPKEIDFGKCILRPKDEFIGRLVDMRIYDSKAAYGQKFISGGEILAIQQIMKEEHEDDQWDNNVMHIGQGFDTFFRKLVRVMKSVDTGPTICLFNSQCHQRPGYHWASLFIVKSPLK